MITSQNISELLKGYDLKNLTIGVLGGHSALDTCHGAKKHGFKTLVVCQKGREKTYAEYYKTRKDSSSPSGEVGCVDEVIIVDNFGDIVKPEIQEQLRSHNTIFIHSRYFWVYCDFNEIENNFMVPIFGSRTLVKLEERDHPNNQYVLLEKAGVRTPKIIRPGDSGMTEEELNLKMNRHFTEVGSPLIVKVNEATRTYERAFFVVTSRAQYNETSRKMIESGKITAPDLEKAVIEEFILGAQINFNFFYSPLTDRLELVGTDTRRQTSLDGFLRLDAKTQLELIEAGIKPSMIENGHVACTVKESILEKAFEVGEKFVSTIKKEVDGGIIGPFALQGAVAAYDGKEEIVIFDVSMRIPGSPGTRFTPYSGYLYGENLSYGERIAMELKKAINSNNLESLLT